MRVLRIISFVVFATISLSLSLKSEPADLEDIFVRLAIQHRGNFHKLEKEERREVLMFCNAAHNKIKDQLLPASEKFPLIVQGLEEHSPSGQILRICIDLPKTLKDITAGLTPELTFWKDRLKFLIVEKTNKDLAHLPIQFDEEGRASKTKALLSALDSLKKQLTSLISFMGDLSKISAGGITNKTQVYDDDIYAFSRELLRLRENDDHVIDPQLVEKMRNRSLALSGTITFNDKIISFCGRYSDALSALDIIFSHLKSRYIDLTKTLEEIDPTRKKSKHKRFFKATKGFVGFQNIAKEIFEKYRPLKEDLSKKLDRVERQLTLHHLLMLTIRSKRLSDFTNEPKPDQTSSSIGLKDKARDLLGGQESGSSKTEPSPSSSSQNSSVDKD